MWCELSDIGLTRNLQTQLQEKHESSQTGTQTLHFSLGQKKTLFPAKRVGSEEFRLIKINVRLPKLPAKLKKKNPENIHKRAKTISFSSQDHEPQLRTRSPFPKKQARKKAAFFAHREGIGGSEGRSRASERDEGEGEMYLKKAIEKSLRWSRKSNGELGFTTIPSCFHLWALHHEDRDGDPID